jgi:succinate dehydrogenase hydrophobic anchor subunit
MSLTNRSRPADGTHAAVTRTSPPRPDETVETTTASAITLKSRRTVYGRSGSPTSLGMWLFQRLSGLLLGPLVFVHVLVPSAPKMVWVSSLLLAIILGHAFIGLWRVAAMRRFSLPVARLGVALTAAFVVVIGVFGIALLASL